MTATVQQRLDGIELTPRAHFQVSLHAAVFAVVDRLRRLDPGGDPGGVLARHPFLAGYLDAALPYLPAGLAWADGHRWWADTIAAWEDAGRRGLPLCRLDAAAALAPPGRIQLLCAGLVEEDSRFGPVFAELTGGGSRRPSLELLAAVSAGLAGGDVELTAVTARRLVDVGLVEVPDPGAPRSEWVAQVRGELWEVLRGVPGPALDSGTGYVPPADLPELADLVLPPEVLARAASVAAVLDGSVDLLSVRGSAGSDRRALAGAIARAAGHGVLRVDRARTGTPSWPVIGPLAVALDAVPVVELDLAPGETAELARPPALTGPLVAVLGSTGGLDRGGHDRVVSLEVPPLGAADRARRWRAAFGTRPVPDLPRVAAGWRLQGAYIERVARGATILADVDGAPEVTTGHLRSAAADLNRELLDTLTTRLETGGCWNDLVVGDQTGGKLLELEARCRYRDGLDEHLGVAFGTGTGGGVRALFTGPSGTGKTLAARVLAGRLGLEVYRVDLAAVVDKYVGETEKNLHRVLTAAEELDVVLLVDEGDSLLGRRTDVRSANDRFANLETNYLLQRLEGYRGIVVVTTNAGDNVDPAFQRRMDVAVPFLPPTARERRDIWSLHLPEGHRVPGALLDELAHRCAMTGGQIRNAVLLAVLLALQDDRPVGGEHLEPAVANEYRKSGATSPYDPSGRRHPTSPARTFRGLVT
ncbi:ATP-binding protein [Geodermatophilus sp. SYSU D00804]